MRQPKLFWIKERINPQLGTYYVACGRMWRYEAKAMEDTLYGENIMHEYRSEKDYNAKLAELRKQGKRTKALSVIKSLVMQVRGELATDIITKDQIVKIQGALLEAQVWIDAIQASPE